GMSTGTLVVPAGQFAGRRREGGQAGELGAFMGSEVQPYDDEAGFGPRTGDHGSQGSEWAPGDGAPGEDPGPGRRRFLALAGAAAGAAPLAGLLRHGHRGAAAPRAVPGNADWMALRSALSTHKLIRPASKSYSTAKELFDPRFDFKRPAGIAYCASPRDVSTCLAFVRKFGLPVAA